MHDRWLPLLGASAALAVILAIFIPYAILSASELSVYYSVGPISPLVLSVFAGVTFVALTGIIRGETDPATTTGAALVVSIALTALLAWWAVAATSVVGSLDVSATFTYHRWILVALASIIPLTAAVYARTILRPQRP